MIEIPFLIDWLKILLLLTSVSLGTSAGQLGGGSDISAIEKEIVIVANKADLAKHSGEAFERVLDACRALAQGKDNRIFDAADAYDKQFGKPLRIDSYPSEEATKRAHWLRDWLSNRVHQGGTIVLLGDEKSLPIWQLNLEGIQFATDSPYGDLDGDGVPETSVCRIVGPPEIMIRQLSGKSGYNSRAIILCSEDTRIHLETRAFAKHLAQLGYDVSIRGARDDEVFTSSDFIIHFGHGNPSGISNRFGEAFVTALSMPAMPRSPIVFVDGCGTLPVGSPLLNSFLKRGALGYLGSTATVQGMIPARFTNELVEHFLSFHSNHPDFSIPYCLMAARAAYVRGHPGLNSRLCQLDSAGSIRASPDELPHLLTVAEWVYYGDPRATMPKVGPPKDMTRQAFSLAKPIRLDEANSSWQTSFQTKANDGQAVLALYADMPLSDLANFSLAVSQNSKELAVLNGRELTIYQRIGRDCRGGYVSGDVYRARFLLPLIQGEGTQKLELRLVSGTSAVVMPGTVVDIWPPDFEKKIGLRQESARQEKALAIPKVVIPEENTKIPEQMHACAANFQKIYVAIGKYKKEKSTLPGWLSDLVPDYLSAETLLCPNDSQKNSPYAPDSYVPCSYSYEFSIAQFDSMSQTRYRDQRAQQVTIFGSVVPLVRCHHHGETCLNISIGGQLYWSPLVWEQMFKAPTRVKEGKPL